MHKKSSMYLVISNLFLVFLGAGLVIPILPDLKEQMNFTGTTMGLMISIFAFAELVASPITGALSDKYGRKKLIALGMLVFAFSQFLFGISEVKSWFYVSRALGGIAAAMVMPAVTAYVADVTTLKERTKAMGIVSAAISGGFIIGPGIGGFIAQFGIRVPFYFAAILSLLGFILTLTMLKEPQRAEMHHENDPEANSMMKILKNPMFGALFVIILISSFGLQAFESIYSIMSSINFGFSSGEIAMIVTVSGALALFFQLFLFDKIISHIGEIGLIQLTFFVSAIFIAAIAFTKSNLVVIFSTFIVFLAFDLFRPAVTTYLSKHAGHAQGAINGLNSAFTSFGNILGPIAAGALFDFNHVFPYYVSAVILLLTGFLSLFLSRGNLNTAIKN
ncbi:MULTISPECIES: MFS transporter [unclassified Lactococcus]|uniref:MFS transporter n=1 Tax=unclassified Lactococcus TaxID=2643510 RepID=UPI0011C77BFB|nr:MULTISPECIES: MFS transporter [unclassified Lactococcus]MQW23105.1 MFS transporter [Lactococcus sp. dk101]TXK44160.1 MFS transporter [Lactococcus sp. dk310]TXK49891.1 MFS transporter [Lactococcus sp. dk322]